MTDRRRTPHPHRLRGVAAVSLAATAGLLGTYLGNARTPRAYAQPGAPFEEFFLPNGGLPAAAPTGPLRDFLADGGEGLFTTPGVVPSAAIPCTASVGTAGGLRNAVKTAVDGDVICVTNNIANLNQELVVDDTALTIIGAGGPDSLSPVTITAGNNRHLRATFTDPGKGMYLANMTFREGNSNLDGGSIYIDGPGGSGSSGFVGLVRMSFKGNTAQRGGAVFAKELSQLIVNESTFTNNEAIYGGAIFAGNVGVVGAVASNLSRNSASIAGGAIDARTDSRMMQVGMSGVTMTNNSAGVNGGAVSAQGIDQNALVLIVGADEGGSVFTNNSAGAGGAINLSETGPSTTALAGVLGDVTMADNTAAIGDGGAMRVSTDDSAAPGGGLQPNLLIASDYEDFTGAPVFSGNRAAGNGGAVRVSGVLDVGGVTYGFNPADDTLVRGASFTGNRATLGGAASVDGLAVTLFSSFTGNTATSGGGAIATDNLAARPFSYRGVLSFYSAFTGNSAKSAGGGAVLVDDGEGTANVVSSTFARNTAATSGGAISLPFGPGFIQNSTLTANESGGVGGALAVGPGAIALVNFSTITANTAFYGGGISAPLTGIQNSIINRNRVTGPSGGFGDITGLQVADSYTLFTSPTSVSAAAWTAGTGSQFSTAPVVGPLADNGGPTIAGGSTFRTMAPLNNSPVISGAQNDTSSFPDFDQRGPGYPRIDGPRATLGAIEWSSLSEGLAIKGRRGSGAGANRVSVRGVLSGFYSSTVFLSIRIGSRPAKQVQVTVRDGGRFAWKKRTAERVVVVAKIGALESPAERIPRA